MAVWHKKFLLWGKILATSLVLSGFSSPSVSQKPLTTPNFIFEVISVRPSQPTQPLSIKVLPDGFQAHGVTVDTLVLIANFPAPYFKHHDGLHGGPAWMSTDRYDVDTRVASEQTAAWSALDQNMMQTSPALQSALERMLEDRFSLRTHRSQQTADGYGLTLSGSPNKLHSSNGDATSIQGMRLPDGGMMLTQTDNGKRTAHFYNASMESLTQFLAIASNAIVINQTNLGGKFNFELPYLDAEVPSPQNSSERPIPFDLRAAGFKLVRTKIQLPIITVDAISKPTLN